MKVCNVCNKLKNIEEFHKDKTRKDGRKYVCKSCLNVKRVNSTHLSFDRSLATSIYQSMKANKSGYAWEKIVGFSIDDLKEKLEETFDDDMTWENYGDIWVMDKIIPPSYYKYSDIKNNELKKCWSLKNFRAVRKTEKNKKNSAELRKLIIFYQLFDILPVGLIKMNIFKLDELNKQKIFI